MKLVQKKQKKEVLQKLYKSPNKKLQLKDGNHLTREEQIRLIQWLVELKSYRQISDLITEEFKKNVTRQAVYFYAQSKKWRPIIARLRNRFEKNITKIPIANKSHRLRILQKVVDEGLTWSLKGFSKDGDEIYELKLGAVTEAIKAAKEEVEGKIPLIDNSTHYHFTNLQGEKLVAEARKRGIPIPEPIARRFGDTREVKQVG